MFGRSDRENLNYQCRLFFQITLTALLPARWENIAGLRFVIKMQFDLAGNELRQDRFCAAFNGRLIRTVSGDELLDNGLKRRDG
jgi:hypothetical protein